MWNPPATSITSRAVTVCGWHGLQVVCCGCGCGGGEPWHVPQAASPSPTVVQSGVLLVPPPRVAPWQYVLVHSPAVVTLQSGVSVPPALVRVLQVSSAGDGSMWAGSPTVAGTTWHSSQLNARRMAPSVRCDWWAPTVVSAVELLPLVSSGVVGHATVAAVAGQVDVHVAVDVPVRVGPGRVGVDHVTVATAARGARRVGRIGRQGVARAASSRSAGGVGPDRFGKRAAAVERGAVAVGSGAGLAGGHPVRCG